MKINGRQLFVVGTHFGDEGKGKLIDTISRDFDYAVRFSGGNNAGHTVYHNGTKVALHLIPSAVFHKRTMCVLAPGVVVDPIAMEDEINQLKKIGIDLSERLKISGNCPLIFSCHKQLDKYREKLLGTNKIGTTGKGIGPAYEDVVGRRAIKIYDLLGNNLTKKLDILHGHYALQLGDEMEKGLLFEEAHKAKEIVSGYVCNTVQLLLQAEKNNQCVLYEGAQGSMLDLAVGTWPYITSSFANISGIYVGTHLPPRGDIYTLGICKAYTTRVGEGPLPTEIEGENQELLTTLGNEFGATTGRKRRCGWLDIPILRRSIQRNNIDVLCITKLDVLDTLDKISICTSYQINGIQSDLPPDDIGQLDECRPNYTEIDGWKTDITAIRNYKDLPHQAQYFIEQIQSMAGIPVIMVSVGVNREQLVWCREEDSNLQELPH